MKLTGFFVENFRCYSTKTYLPVDDLTVIVGKNDIGKSTLFDALAIFFEEGKLDGEDLCLLADESKEIRLTCVFNELPEEIILDSDCPTSLEKEYLLNENGHLVITKIYNGKLKTPTLSQTLFTAFHPTEELVSNLLSLNNADLKRMVKDRGLDYLDIDSRMNPQLRHVLLKNTDDLNLRTRSIEVSPNIQKSILKTLPQFALFKSDRASTDQDSEVQDPLKTVIKSALEQKKEELEKIEEFVRTQVEEISRSTLSKLQEMDEDLASELNPQFATGKWESIFKISLTGDNEIPINKRGSGVRRLVLLNFFRAKAEMGNEDNPNGIIYAIEEPETSQHPNNQKMLLKALQDISDQNNHQVLITTHTPVLAKLVCVDSLRFISRDNAGMRKIQFKDDGIFGEITTSLGILPDNDVQLFIGVEGKNDIEFFKNYSKKLLDFGFTVPDLPKLEEEEKVIFVPVGGSNLALWVSRLKGLNKPEFYLFDRDDDGKYQKIADEINKRGNCLAKLTTKREMENYIHPDAISIHYEGFSATFSPTEDVPYIVAKWCHEQSSSSVCWDALGDEKQKQKTSQAKKQLNSKCILSMTKAMYESVDPDHEVITWFVDMQRWLERSK